jgi:hypothetical protein
MATGMMVGAGIGALSAKMQGQNVFRGAFLGGALGGAGGALGSAIQGGTAAGASTAAVNSLGGGSALLSGSGGALSGATGGGLLGASSMGGYGSGSLGGMQGLGFSGTSAPIVSGSSALTTAGGRGISSPYLGKAYPSSLLTEGGKGVSNNSISNLFTKGKDYIVDEISEGYNDMSLLEKIQTGMTAENVINPEAQTYAVPPAPVIDTRSPYPTVTTPLVTQIQDPRIQKLAPSNMMGQLSPEEQAEYYRMMNK